MSRKIGNFSGGLEQFENRQRELQKKLKEYEDEGCPPPPPILTEWADVVLFAVRWAKTRRHVARGVLEMLQGDGSVPVPVGSVLTRVNLRKHAGYRLGDSADLLREKVT